MLTGTSCWKMKGVVLAVFSIISVSLTNAHYRKKPKIEIFEIRENQLNQNIDVQPVKLKYDLESEEKNSELSKLSKILLSYENKKAEDASRNIIKKIKSLKGVGKKKMQPVVLIVSPEYFDMLSSKHESEQELVNGFLDETRTQALVKPGSEVVFNIVPPNRARKIKKLPKLPPILRMSDLIEDRTDAPLSRGRDRPYSDED